MAQMVYDITDTRELTVTVRELEANQDDQLRPFLPSRSVEDLDYRIIEIDPTNRIAPVRAFDTPAPTGVRPGARERRGSLPPISIQYPLTEAERHAVRRLYGVEGDAVARNVYNDAATGTRNITNRLELLRGEAMSTGQIVIDENEVNQAIDYGLPADNQQTAPTAWNTTDADGNYTADVLGNLLNWNEIYPGDGAGVMLTSKRVRSLMLQNQGIRDLLHVPSSLPSVPQGQLGQVLDMFGLPSLQVYDRTVEDASGNEVRVIPENKVIFLPGQGSQRIGETQFGLTEEAVSLAQSRVLAAAEAPGLVAVTLRSDDPVMTSTKVAAIGLPVIQRPRYVLYADVF